MATFNLRRFSQPVMLRKVDRRHLITFFKPHASYFLSRGLKLPPQDSEEELDYKILGQILLNPNTSTPQDLAESLLRQ